MYVVAAQFEAARGKGPAAAALTAEIRDTISSIIGRPVYAWSVAMGAPLGTMMISTRADSMAQWLGDAAKMNQDAGYQKLAAKASDLLDGPTQTRFSSVIAATETGEPKQFVSVTSATMAGKTSVALKWSGEVLEHVTGTIGHGGQLTVGAQGNFQEVTWIFGNDTAEDIDEGEAKLMADAAYQAKVDDANTMFVPGSGLRGLLVKMP